MLYAPNYWVLKDTVQALCCDTIIQQMLTSSRDGEVVLLKQNLDRDMLYLPCRKHIWIIL